MKPINLFEDDDLEEKEKLTDDDLQKLHDKKYKVKKMTPRQWRLLDLIKHNSKFLEIMSLSVSRDKLMSLMSVQIATQWS